MKRLILLLLTISSVMSINAQTPIKDQPGQSYFDMLEKAIIDKTIPEAELLAMKPASIPENFMDTLKKYDWVYLGGYFYTESKFSSYNTFYKEYHMIRYDENGGELSFSINGYQNYVINSLNFKNPPRKTVSIHKSGNSYFFKMVVSDGTEYQKILSYQNGTLVYLVSKTGKITDTKAYFREVYTAVPKGFTWTFGE